MINYIFESLSQCILGVAAQYLGTAEISGPGIQPDILSWQRTGGIYSSLDETNAPWSALFVNAVATYCDAERVHDWQWWCADRGEDYALYAQDWLGAGLLQESLHISPATVQPGDVVVWAVNGVHRAGIFADRLTFSTYLIIAGDQADAVRLAPISVNAIVGARRLAPARLVCETETP